MFPFPIPILRPSYLVEGDDFNGTNQYMNRGADLTSNADGKLGIFSTWLRLDGGNSTTQYLYATTSARVFIARNSSNKLQVLLRNTAGGTILNMVSTTSFTANSAWRHMLASWDLGNTTASLYIDDVDETNFTTSPANQNANYSLTEHWCGTYLSAPGYFNGCLSDFYFNMEEYIDLSVQSNRRKFISSQGKPVSLGTDGSKPTGNTPRVFFHLDHNETDASVFATNRGSGGDFSIQNGPLSIASSSPSD